MTFLIIRGVYKVACNQIEAMTRILQMLVEERKSRKKYPGLYASICSQTWWCAYSQLPSCQVRVARQGRKIRLKCLAEDDPHKNLSHNACEFHSGPRPNRACQREDCSCDTRHIQQAGASEIGEGYTHPRRVRILAFGLGSPGLPLKLTRRMPPQRSPPCPTSHSLMCDHARSFTALWMGTTTFMSGARGSWFLRAIAA
jgi:hypothetical protein